MGRNIVMCISIVCVNIHIYMDICIYAHHPCIYSLVVSIVRLSIFGGSFVGFPHVYMLCMYICIHICS